MIIENNPLIKIRSELFSIFPKDFQDLKIFLGIRSPLWNYTTYRPWRSAFAYLNNCDRLFGCAYVVSAVYVCSDGGYYVIVDFNHFLSPGFSQADCVTELGVPNCPHD